MLYILSRLWFNFCLVESIACSLCLFATTTERLNGVKKFRPLWTFKHCPSLSQCVSVCLIDTDCLAVRYNKAETSCQATDHIRVTDEKRRRQVPEKVFHKLHRTSNGVQTAVAMTCSRAGLSDFKVRGKTRYRAVIKTGRDNRDRAGTDDTVHLTLTGKLGEIVENIDSDDYDDLERGTTHEYKFDGTNIGEVKTIEFTMFCLCTWTSKDDWQFAGLDLTVEHYKGGKLWTAQYSSINNKKIWFYTQKNSKLITDRFNQLFKKKKPIKKEKPETRKIPFLRVM